MHRRGRMVIMLTTTLVHLVTLGSSTLFSRWRTEEQVIEEGELPDQVGYSRHGTKVKRAFNHLRQAALVRRRRRREKRRRKENGEAVASDSSEEDDGDHYQDRRGSQKARYLREQRKNYTEMVNNRSVEVVTRKRRARGGNAKVNVLILMSDTGGGHRASAEALEAAFDQLYPGSFNVTMVDIWTEHSRWPTSNAVPAYQYAAKNPIVWRTMYEYMRFPPTRWLSDRIMTFSNFNRFTEALLEYDPDLVVSVHPLCQDLPLKVLRFLGEDGKRQLPFVTVVTDLGGAHPTWFNAEADKIFISSEAVMRVAYNVGIERDRLYNLGLPVRPAFWQDSSPKDTLRRELGLREEGPAAMIVGGGDGVGSLGAIAMSLIHELAARVSFSQVVVVCGKNAVLKNELEEAAMPDNVHVIINGFVRNMDEWMGAIDVIITKAGPGTIAEAAIRGLPVMLSHYLPGQEEGNVPFVVDGGFGDYSKKPKVIAEKVATWLGDPELLKQMSLAALRHGKPKATFDIAREIGAMAFAEADDSSSSSTSTSQEDGLATANEGGAGAPAQATDDVPTTVEEGAGSGLVTTGGEVAEVKA